MRLYLYVECNRFFKIKFVKAWLFEDKNLKYWRNSFEVHGKRKMFLLQFFFSKRILRQVI